MQAAARKLRLDEKAEEARKLVHEFLRKLCGLRVLDPACGTGNFLYVALDLFKRIESEVLALLRELGEVQEKLLIEGERVTPKQFLGIEVKPWAKEIADLVLWIGFLQWHYKSHGKGMPPAEPVLMEYQNIECRDAVLAWDTIELVTDRSGKPVTRWDGETYKKSSVTGEDVPDDAAQVPTYKYLGVKKAVWPKADFVVGNPPFVGNKRMRLLLSSGYVDALRRTYDDVPETADYVMYWWHKAAALTEANSLRRFGLITTNSITQTFNRKVVEPYLRSKTPISIVFAIPDHPWVDAQRGAAVRIGMTVAQAGDLPGESLLVLTEGKGEDIEVKVTLEGRRGKVHSNLTAGPNISGAQPLRANQVLSFQGIIPLGDGFRLNSAELQSLGVDLDNLPAAVRKFVIGRDLVQRFEKRCVIDFFGLTEEASRTAYPQLYQHIVERVKPERDLNRRDTRRKNWWLFGENAPKMRRALAGLKRFVVTIETSKYKPFMFLDGDVLVDHKVYAVASDDAYVLAVLSSRIHASWALAAGGRLGVGNDPTWTNSTCFLPFPFPTCTDAHKIRIRDLGEQLDTHRKRQQAQYSGLTITGMYNVLEKLRKGEPLLDKDKSIYEQGLISVLKKIHDDLDAAVLVAYGWPVDLTDDEILQKLVDLNAERAEEERKGHIRWLRPDFQNPAGAKPAAQEDLIEMEEAAEATEAGAAVGVKAWPKKLAERIAAVRDCITAWGRAASAEEVAASFKRAPRKDVEEMLDSLAAVGVLTALQTEGGKRWKATARAA